MARLTLNGPAAPVRRRRNTVLQALEAVRGLGERETPLSSILIFLYVCENEGLNCSELAYLTKLDLATACRAAKRLTQSETAAGAALLEFVGDPVDRRVRKLILTAEGRELRARIEGMIAEAAPIRPPELSEQDAA